MKERVEEDDGSKLWCYCSLNGTPTDEANAYLLVQVQHFVSIRNNVRVLSMISFPHSLGTRSNEMREFTLKESILEVLLPVRRLFLRIPVPRSLEVRYGLNNANNPAIYSLSLCDYVLHLTSPLSHPRASMTSVLTLSKA